jgi:hypothetical protein
VSEAIRVLALIQNPQSSLMITPAGNPKKFILPILLRAN